jgi:hypothetical protein
MTRTFYLLLGAGIIALTAIASEPAGAQGKYKVSPAAPGVGSGSGLKAKPPSHHGKPIVHMNKQAQGGSATGRRQHQPIAIKPRGLSMDPQGPMGRRGSLPGVSTPTRK